LSIGMNSARKIDERRVVDVGLVAERRLLADVVLPMSPRTLYLRPALVSCITDDRLAARRADAVE
jgi:hypothetical protein